MLLSFSVSADEYLIREMEDLYTSLTYDDPAKSELTLRLADLYFDVSIMEGHDAELITKRKRSLALYTQALEGSEGVQKVTGQLQVKVQFQIGRLLSKLGQDSAAAQHFEAVFETARDKNLKREAAFQLANWYEKDTNFEKTDKFYQEAIKLCNSIDSCNYAHYKRGWLLYKETKLEDAINELKLSLWDAKGQVREKVLNDYIMFLSNRMTDGLSELKEIEKLTERINRPEIMRQLAESYFTAGNRIAGTNLLSYIDRKNPSLYYQVRLLEENYGLGNWSKVTTYLNKLDSKSAKDLPKDKQQADEVLKISRRFIVQLDAETQTNPKYNIELKQAINIYLKLYPNDELRRKMQEGWLKAENSTKKKIQQLAIWIKEDGELGIQASEIRKLRQSRLALAQQEKISDVVVEESLAIAQLVDSVEAREFEYVAARQMYELKQFDKAKTLFEKLADAAITLPKVDKWGLLSQNLLLDVYNQEKRFDAIIEQSSKWTQNEKLASDNSIKNELKQMNDISRQAKFEWAVAQGESAPAMTVFYDYCMQNIFADKSCINAKVLAIKLSDQQKLISLLEKAKDEQALVIEYELMGRFADAAILNEKLFLNKKKDIASYLKVALLYELDYDFKNRNRILNSLISFLINQKNINPEYEKALYVTLEEANLLNQNSLRIPWSVSTKLRLAHRLEVEKPNVVTKKILISETSSVGPAWSKLVLSKIQPLDMTQRKISFYGRNSKYLFQKRSRSIEKLSTEAKKYLEGADVETRVYLLDMMAKAYKDLGQDILNTPLPDGLDNETLLQVKEQLQAMAKPFEDVASDYTRLMRNELISMQDLTDRNRIEVNITTENPDYASFIIIDETRSLDVASINYSTASELKGHLASSPNAIETLEGLEKFYKSNRSERIASYFTGRINSLRKQEQI